MTVLNHQGEIIEVDAAGPLRSLETLGAEGGSQVYIEAGEDIETLAEHLASIEIVALNFPAFSEHANAGEFAKLRPVTVTSVDSDVQILRGSTASASAWSSDMN